ncbi:actin polymerization protein [Colletotrichum truncatum]|uniref:Actin polymerization protein n=1 Tax=Colletotrichum truncatum TaxID=5467 RepID=A0ACC3ZFV9_COLTU|nr:actin polymerization protein [Colletotrichum truncatum]KAF6801710.1 actin polymerization protein [Colletotrichum truncatum]
MTIKAMSEVEDTSAHKRTASTTSAVQNSPPPAKRPAPATLPTGRRDFPHAVALVFYKDGGDDIASSTTVLGVYAGLADANDEVRKLALEQGAKLDDAAAHNTEPVRWDTPEGVSCWVELHAVKPKTIVRRNVSESSAEPPKKLYDAEEGEDPDLDDDDQEEGGHYD